MLFVYHFMYYFTNILLFYINIFFKLTSNELDSFFNNKNYLNNNYKFFNNFKSFKNFYHFYDFCNKNIKIFYLFFNNNSKMNFILYNKLIMYKLYSFLGNVKYISSFYILFLILFLSKKKKNILSINVSKDLNNFFNLKNIVYKWGSNSGKLNNNIIYSKLKFFKKSDTFYFFRNFYSSLIEKRDNFDYLERIKFTPSEISKKINFHNVDNYEINFIRKNKIFNKGRYSRNRQTYRTGVYWCLYINVIVILGLYGLFYGFWFKFGYIWWIMYFFFLSFFFNKFIKYDFVNIKKLILSLYNDCCWIFSFLECFYKFLTIYVIKLLYLVNSKIRVLNINFYFNESLFYKYLNIFLKNVLATFVFFGAYTLNILSKVFLKNKESILIYEYFLIKNYDSNKFLTFKNYINNIINLFFKK